MCSCSCSCSSPQLCCCQWLPPSIFQNLPLLISVPVSAGCSIRRCGGLRRILALLRCEAQRVRTSPKISLFLVRFAVCGLCHVTKCVTAQEREHNEQDMGQPQMVLVHYIRRQPVWCHRLVVPHSSRFSEKLGPQPLQRPRCQGAVLFLFLMQFGPGCNAPNRSFRSLFRKFTRTTPRRARAP